MPKRTKGPDSLAEMSGSVADELVQGGVMEADTPQGAAHRHLADPELSIEHPIPSSADIRAMRQKANLSQAAFAQRLQLSAGYISQLERGVKRPTGAAVVLLNLIGRRGIDVIS